MLERLYMLAMYYVLGQKRVEGFLKLVAERDLYDVRFLTEAVNGRICVSTRGVPLELSCPTITEKMFLK